MIKETNRTRNKKKLKNFLALSPESAEYKAMKDEIKIHLTNPGSLEKYARTSGIREEVQTILDAFEAITNGMYNPEVFAEMERIPESSLLSFWKELILAIRAFYRKDYSEMEKHLNNLDNDSPLAMFKPILMHLSGKTRQQISNSRQKEFIDMIIKDRSFIRSVTKQISESLEYDMEELFIETTSLLLIDLNRNHKEAAIRFAIWGIETASVYKYSPTDIVATCKKLFGNTEAYRLTAIALAKEEGDISLLFWIQSLLSRLKSTDISLEEAAAYLTIISRSAEEIGSSSDNFYLASLKGLIAEISSDLSEIFPGNLESIKSEGNPFEDLINLSAAYSSLEEDKIRLKSLSKRPKPITIKSPKKGDEPVQLSLF